MGEYCKTKEKEKIHRQLDIGFLDLLLGLRTHDAKAIQSISYISKINCSNSFARKSMWEACEKFVRGIVKSKGMEFMKVLELNADFNTIL